MAEIWNLSALCRCCHKDGQFTDLRTLLQDSDTRTYMTLLQETFNVSMDEPLFDASYSICDMCIEDLIRAHSFKVQVVECEQKFHEYCQNELAMRWDLKEEVESLHEEFVDDNDNCNFDDFDPNDTGDSIELEDVEPDFADDQEAEHDNQKVIKTKQESLEVAGGRSKQIQRGRSKKRPLTGAEKSRRYRDRLKAERPDEYKAQCKRNLDRIKAKKKKISEMSIEEANEQRKKWRNEKNKSIRKRNNISNKRPLTGAEKSRRYRDRLKAERPDEYKAQCKRNLDRIKAKKKKISEMSIEEANEQRKKWRNERNKRRKTKNKKHGEKYPITHQ